MSVETATTTTSSSSVSDSSVNNPPQVVGAPPSCSFYIKKKRRFCRFRPNNDDKYCSEHIYLLNDPTRRKRIPCPLDSKHTVYEDNLDSHLKKCNKRQRVPPIYHINEINSGSLDEGELCPDKVSVLTASSNHLASLIQQIDQVYKAHTPEITKEELWHGCMDEEMNNPYYGIQAQRQRRQQASLIGHLEKLNLLKKGYTYVELGAGKGQLSHCLQRAIPDNEDGLYVLVDKSHIRYKLELSHQFSEGGPTFERLNTDLQHLCLALVPSIKNSKRPLVGMGKHLCGAGTDFALRCLTESRENGKESENKFLLAGIVLATCCHHRCTWVAYTGKKFFKDVGLTGTDFQLMTSMSSWATCVWKGWRETQTPGAETATKNNDEDEHVTLDNMEPNDTDSKMSKRMKIEEEEKEEHGVAEVDVRANFNIPIEQRESIGQKCKQLIDYGRLLYLKEKNLDVEMKEYIDATMTPENIVLLAKSKQ
ncbi:tRNA:m(4)X modification enzyme TRM13 homolog [Octopus sinensis]|nr:tRNA:m(4)X modification enzyme TRM13 homolog [Octopus sinensis]